MEVGIAGVRRRGVCKGGREARRASCFRSRTLVYYLGQPTPQVDVALMGEIDRLHLAYSFAGSRMLRLPGYGAYLRAYESVTAARPDLCYVGFYNGRCPHPRLMGLHPMPFTFIRCQSRWRLNPQAYT
jgi:hypothetical protein